jgi:hypothetical protein
MINKMNSPLFFAGLSKWEAFVSSYTGAYDFKKSVYAGMNKKVTFVCPAHGVMQMDAKNIMRGALCIKCAVEARSGKTRFTRKQMLAKFKDAHNDRYDYSLTEYKGQQTPVIIVCKSHGEFLQKPEYHWSGSGCPTCYHQDRRGASQRDTLESVVEKIKNQFGDLFDLSNVTYVNSQQKIKVVCTKHNEECETKANWLINGCNPCPKCNHMKSSQELAVAKFIKAFTSVIQRDRSVIKPKELDIYMPNNALAVEYSGMYWHSHGSIEEENKSRYNHYNKYKSCEANGVRLITVYETEWIERQKAIKRLLRNSIGKSKGKLMARKCELKKVTRQEAGSFYDKYHPQGGAGNGEHYGLYWKNKLVSCMRFTYGVNDRGTAAANRVWTLSRYATRVTVSGGASKLFKAFIEEYSPEEVKSFSDNRYFAGGMYAQLGFDLEEDVSPDYQIWSPKIGLKPKSHYQRRNIQQRLIEHGMPDVFDPKTDTRTEREMTYLMGARRIYDCGKKRWVWKPK